MIEYVSSGRATAGYITFSTPRDDDEEKDRWTPEVWGNSMG